MTAHVGLDEQLARYGARIGIVEPLLHRMCRQIAAIEAVRADLRASGQYALADRLRDVVTEMQDAADYAFPGKYIREGQP